MRVYRTVVLTVLVLASVGMGGRAGQGSQDTRQYLSDLDSLEAFTAANYANLDWKVRRGGIDPVALHRRTDSLLRAARNDRDARRALSAFVAAFGDGHFRVESAPRNTSASSSGGAGTSSPGPSLRADARSVCGAWGYGSERSSTFLARVRDYRSLERNRLPFERGVIARNGQRLAVLRIDSFGIEPHRWACEAAWPVVAARSTGTTCSAPCAVDLRLTVADTLAAALRDAISDLASTHPDALVIDVTGNGGGTEWVTKAARVVTPHPIPGGVTAVIRSDQHAESLARRVERVDGLLLRSLDPMWRDTVVAARDRLVRAHADASAPCDRRSIWVSGPEAVECDGLVHGLWTTGAAPLLAPDLAGDQPGAPLIYSLALNATAGGTWSGPLILVTDGATASASEEFVSVLADHAGALVAGERSYGSGCGYTGYARSIVLPRTRLLVRAPDCVRYRRNGDNEVAGIAPTLDVGWQPGDRPGAKAEKLVRAVIERLATRR